MVTKSYVNKTTLKVRYMDKTKGKKPIKSFYQEEALGPWSLWEELQMNSFIQNRQGGLSLSSHYQG